MRAALFAVGCMPLLDAAVRLGAPHPIYWIAFRMEARQHNDSFLFDYVEDRVREFSQQYSANFLIHDRRSKRISLDTRHACVRRT
jgi:hypothetical protein